jgi:hypothetical protein
MKKLVSSLILVSFLLNGVMPPAVAQVVFMPPAQGTVSLSPAFTPCQLRGVKIDPQDPFRLDFIVEEGDSGLTGQAFEDESQKLIKYFLATLTTPENDLWVNLSPYEDNRIIQDDFGRTAMGRDLLAQDYVLKQITASLMHPDADLGKKFWDEVYKRTFEKYGTTDIPVDTFNKVWIVPERAVIYESSNDSMSAYVDETRLKVMLESDYLAAQEGTWHQALGTGRMPETIGPTSSAQWPVPSAKVDTQDLAKQVVRDVIVPVLEREVNEGRNFAELRQVYHSLLLAVWLKKKLQSAVPLEPVAEKPGIMKGNLLSLIFVNQHKTGGLETADPKAEVRSIYDRYFEAFKKGAYNIIREDYDIYSQELIPRKYFSGGMTFSLKEIDAAMSIRKGRPPMSTRRTFLRIETRIQARIEPEGATTGFFIEERPETREKFYYFQTTRRTIMRAGVFAILASITGGYFFGRTYRSINTSPSPSPQLLPQADDREAERQGGPLTKEKVVRALTMITSRLQSFEYGLNGGSPKLIPVADFLRRLYLEQPSKIRRGEKKTDYEERRAVEDKEAVERLSTRLAELINMLFDKFGGGLREAGLSAEDMARLLLSVMARETAGIMDIEKYIKGFPQARGAGQLEHLTYQEAISVAEAVITENPDNFEDYLTKIQKERKRRLGIGNAWRSKSPLDLVVQTDTHILFMIVWFDYLARVRPIPHEAKLDELDHKQLQEFVKGEGSLTGLTREQVPLYDVWKMFQEKETAGQDQKKVLMVLSAAVWNGGRNIYIGDYRRLVSFLMMKDRERDNFIKTSRGRLDELRGKRERVLEVLEKVRVDAGFVSTGEKIMKAAWGRRPKNKGKTFSYFRSNGPEARAKILKDSYNKLIGLPNSKLLKDKYKDINKRMEAADNLQKRFLDAYRQWRQVEAELASYQWLLDRCIMMATYAEIVGTYGGFSITRKQPQDLGENYRFYRDFAKEVKADAAMGSPYGGIDLQTGQMDLDIRGNAGSFEIEIPTDTLERLRNDVKGFVPLIINVQPLTDVPLFLGLSDSSSNSS